MTPSEFAGVLEYLEDRWPGTKNYRNAPAVYNDFASLPGGAVTEAAQDLFRSGQRYAPTLAELCDQARQRASRYRDDDPTTVACDRRHRHGALGILPDRLTAVTPEGRDSLSAPPEHRIAVCVDCHAELIRPATQLATETERAEGRATREPPPGYDRSDRIAK